MLGLIVNPVAGLGGSVGLKGTDGVVAEALARGAVPRAAERAAAAVAAVDAAIPIACAAGPMGADVLHALGRAPAAVAGGAASGETTAADTRAAARALVDAGVELLLFAGGDGTARDVCTAVDGAVPVLGIPAGVKIQSGVFAESPRRAGELATAWLPSRRRERTAEVVDLDEDLLRAGEVGLRLYGAARVPQGQGLVASAKAPSHDADPADVAGIAARVGELARAGTVILGPGSTTAAIGAALALPTSLLGVDLVRSGELVVADGTERELLDALDADGATTVVTPIGGQGFVLGRGNQQISPAVLRRAGIGRLTVVATPAKLALLGGRPLLVDTGDEETDSELRGWHRLVTGYDHETVYQVE